MSKPIPLSEAFSHWHKAFADFQTSTLEFCNSVETAVDRLAIPGVSQDRVDFREGGIASAEREYLRITRQKLTFDVCAAPFGSGYFFSWWLGVRRPARWLLLLVGLQLLLSIVIAVKIAALKGTSYGPTQVDPWVAMGLAVGLFLILGPGVGGIAKLTGGDFDDPIIVTPLVGPLYVRLFKPMTYFRIDTILMFQSQVKRAVEDAIDGLAIAKGLRALTEDEKKPIMRDFLGK